MSQRGSAPPASALSIRNSIYRCGHAPYASPHALPCPDITRPRGSAHPHPDFLVRPLGQHGATLGDMSPMCHSHVTHSLEEAKGFPKERGS